VESFLSSIDFAGGLTLNELMAWMDGGSVSLSMTDKNQTSFTVIFCQKVALEIHPGTGTWIPGSLLFNDVEVPIRSTSERVILDSLKTFKFSNRIPLKDRPLERKIISDCISFVESEDYLETARIMGRLLA
jgi:hypothetical protein